MSPWVACVCYSAKAPSAIHYCAMRPLHAHTDCPCCLQLLSHPLMAARVSRFHSAMVLATKLVVPQVSRVCVRSCGAI